jgi:hypothetical protein
MPSSALFMADFLPLQLNMRSIVQSGTKSQLNSFESEVQDIGGRGPLMV